MKRWFILIFVLLSLSCKSTLKLNLKSGDKEIMTYDRSGLGVESPYEVAAASWMLAYAEAMSEAVKKDPRNIILYQGWYGYSGYGFTDPCYYYPVGQCPPEVMKQSIFFPPPKEEKSEGKKEAAPAKSTKDSGGAK